MLSIHRRNIYILIYSFALILIVKLFSLSDLRFTLHLDYQR